MGSYKILVTSWLTHFGSSAPATAITSQVISFSTDKQAKVAVGLINDEKTLGFLQHAVYLGE